MKKDKFASKVRKPCDMFLNIYIFHFNTSFYVASLTSKGIFVRNKKCIAFFSKKLTGTIVKTPT